MAERESADSSYVDRCFACRRETPPREIFGPSTISGVVLARAFYTCEADHEQIPHADWWTDWHDDTVRERIMICDPSLGDVGGTTWSGVELARY